MSLALHLYQSPMDNASRLLRMARSIVADMPGINVRLVGLQVDERSGLEPLEAGIVIDRIGSEKPKEDTLTSRFQKLGGWYHGVFRTYKNHDVDVISAHAVWTLPLAFALSRTTKAPVVYNPHELETRTLTMTGVKRVLAERIEAAFIKRCAFVTVVNDQIADWYQERYSIPRPVVVYNYPAKITARPARDLRGELGLSDDDVLFVHMGYITRGRNVELIVRAFEEAASPHVLFVGSGDLQSVVTDAAQRCGFVHHMPPVAPDDVVSVVKGADFGLSLIELSAKSYALSSPNKLFESLASGVPPVCSDLPEARKRLGPLAQDLVLTDPANQLLSFLARVTREDAARYAQQIAPLPFWEDGVPPLLAAYREVMAR